MGFLGFRALGFSDSGFRVRVWVAESRPQTQAPIDSESKLCRKARRAQEPDLNCIEQIRIAYFGVLIIRILLFRVLS